MFRAGELNEFSKLLRQDGVHIVHALLQPEKRAQSRQLAKQLNSSHLSRILCANSSAEFL